MHDPPALAAWSTFYTMIGSSSAALIGLMFVVIGMVMNTRADQRSSDGIHVFSTPTVVHFGAALLAACTFLIPWPGVRYPFAILGAAGVAGVAYMAYLNVRAARLEAYRADLEDWIWYNILPVCGYALYCAGAVVALSAAARGMYIDAAGVVLLMFVAIRNSWDVVTYLAARPEDEPSDD